MNSRLLSSLMVVFLTTPKRIVDLLPVATLLGGLLGLGAMANNRELIAIRTSGLSKRHIAQIVTVMAIFLGIFITTLQFTVVPGFEREAAHLRGKSLEGIGQAQQAHCQGVLYGGKRGHPYNVREHGI